MPSYKLTYFNITGLGEPIRLLLSYMNQPFEDIRIDWPPGENWPQFKQSTLFGKLPMLEVDGKLVCQSTSICRYLAKQCGLAGEDDWESFMIDMMVDVFNDFRIEVTKVFVEKDEAQKKEMIENIKKETIPFYLGKIEETIKNNDGHLVNGKLSWGDILVTSVVQTLCRWLKEDLSLYPLLKQLVNTVETLPGIQQYIAQRPVTPI